MCLPVRYAWLVVALSSLIAAPPCYAHEALKLDALKPNLAATPPMGWNPWNEYACNIDEALVRRQADAMATSGMKDVGYRYIIIIDDCWQKSRDADGNIAVDPERFLSGIKAMVGHVHSNGLKFGLYSDAGALKRIVTARDVLVLTQSVAGGAAAILEPANR